MHCFCSVCLLIFAEKHFVISTLYPFYFFLLFLLSILSHPTYVVFSLSVLCMIFECNCVFFALQSLSLIIFFSFDVAHASDFHQFVTGRFRRYGIAPYSCSAERSKCLQCQFIVFSTANKYKQRNRDTRPKRGRISSAFDS